MGTGKKKIEIKKIEKTQDRIVTFSKRKKGLFNKALQFNQLSGSHIGIIVFSPAGRPHINTPLFDPAIYRYMSSIPSAIATSTAPAGSASADTDTTYSAEVFNEFCTVENPGFIKEWLNDIEVENTDKIEDLLLIKQRLEILREKLCDRICCSYLA